MKLSNETLKVLSNFSSINQNILLKKGSTIRTVNPIKTLYAVYTCSEEFPEDLGIYNLRQFLEVISLFEDPEIEVNDDASAISVSDESSNAHIILSDPENLIVTDNKIKDFESVLTFTLTNDILSLLRKGSTTLKATHIAFETTDDDDVTIRVYDPKPQNSGTNSVSQVICKNQTGSSFKFVFEISQFNFLPGDYQVDVAETRICKFTNLGNEDLTYWIAQDSKYSEYND